MNAWRNAGDADFWNADDADFWNADDADDADFDNCLRQFFDWKDYKISICSDPAAEGSIKIRVIRVIRVPDPSLRSG